MSEFYESATLPLITDYISMMLKNGALCIIGGFVIYTAFSLLAYGIIQTLRLFNIKSY